MKKLLAFLPALALMAGTANAKPVQNLTDTQIQNIAVSSAVVLCQAKKGYSPYPQASTVQEALIIAWKEAGVKDMHAILPPPQDKAIQANIANVMQNMDSDCQIAGVLTYIPPVYPQSQGAYYTPPRQLGNIARCKTYLSRKYVIYTNGQLKNCVANASISDYQNNVPLSQP